MAVPQRMAETTVGECHEINDHTQRKRTTEEELELLMVLCYWKKNGTRVLRASTASSAETFEPNGPTVSSTWTWLAVDFICAILFCYWRYHHKVYEQDFLLCVSFFCFLESWILWSVTKWHQNLMLPAHAGSLYLARLSKPSGHDFPTQTIITVNSCETMWDESTLHYDNNSSLS